MAKKPGAAGGKLKSALWGLHLAWKMNKGMMIGWVGLSIGLSVLPALALGYNKAIITGISTFLSTGTGQYADVVSAIVMLGILLTLSGLSARLSGDLLFMLMYDSYYLGMEEIMMDAAQRIDISEFAKKETNDEYHAVIMRGGSLTDFMSGFCLFAGKMASILSLLLFAFGQSKAVFVVSLLYVSVVAFLNFRFSDKVRFDWAKQLSDLRLADYYEKLPQEAETAKEIRIFESCEKIKKQWLEAYRKVEKSEISRASGIALRTFASSLGFYLFMAAMVVFAIFQVSAGGMQPGLFLTIFTLCIHISGAVENVVGGYTKMDYGLFSLDRQRRFFQNTPAMDEKSDIQKQTTLLDTEVCFEAKNLCFSYAEGTPVLKDLNFKIKTGETVSLVGSNGSGKTTLVKLLLGLYKPTSGTVRFGGRAYEDYRQGFLSTKIGAFFQDFFLYHLSLRENVGAGDVAHMDDENQILQAIQKGGAEKILAKLPKGLENMLGKQVYKDGAELSGGESQRVAVSRAHMSGKEVLVFDEPASMLDPVAEMEQFLNIKGKIGGKTAVLVSHRVGFARLADRILVLSDGQLAEDGTHDELLAKNGVYAEFFNKQAKWYTSAPEEKGAAVHEK